MQGYDDTSYGEAFADVYDEWYADITDVDATVATLLLLAQRSATHPAVLELGVGTGRLAAPLAAAAPGVTVVGIDASDSMLAHLASKPGGDGVQQVRGDMIDDLPPGPFGLVFVAYNTFFSLLTEERQRACFAAVAARLSPGGSFAIEAFVPEPAPTAPRGPSDVPVDAVTVRTITATQVVLSVSRSHHATQRAEGQYVQFTEAGGVRLRPWSIRWATPHQLDEMAVDAGLRLTDRWGGFDRTPFGPDSTRHVSVYGQA